MNGNLELWQDCFIKLNALARIMRHLLLDKCTDIFSWRFIILGRANKRSLKVQQEWSMVTRYRERNAPPASSCCSLYFTSHGHCQLNIPLLIVPKDPILLSWGPVADVLIPEGLRVDHWSWAMCVCTKAQPHLNQSPISCWALSTASLPWQMLRPTWGVRMTEKLPSHEQCLPIPVYSSLLWLFQACWLQGWSLQASPWHEPVQVLF